MMANLILQAICVVWFPAWFIGGDIWVSRTKNRYQSTNPIHTSTYCYGESYRAAFILLIMTYGIFGITICITIKRRFIGKKIKGVVN
ncbi:unnamed protein product, partial [Adineta ricciae]